VECFYESVPIGAPVNIRYQVIKGTLRSHHCVTALSCSFFPPPQTMPVAFRVVLPPAATKSLFSMCRACCMWLEKKRNVSKQSSSSSWARCRWFSGCGREHVRPEP
jgi:hypothetical protein